jgi:hypothetical protein
MTLQDITGQESGAVLFPKSGEIIICNWTQVEGIPRLFTNLNTLIGLGESLDDAEPCEVPAEVITVMQEHEREQGTPVSTAGFSAWRVADVIVVTQEDWA